MVNLSRDEALDAAVLMPSASRRVEIIVTLLTGFCGKFGRGYPRSSGSVNSQH